MDAVAEAEALLFAWDVVALGSNGVKMGSNVVKMHVFWMWMEGQQVHQGVPSVWMNGVQMLMPAEREYVRLLGHHALPLVYHKEDLRKLMSAAHTATAVVSPKSF